MTFPHAGRQDGIVLGARAIVFESVEISDPDTAEPLGEVRKAIAFTLISEVEDLMSVGHTYRTIVAPGGSPLEGLFTAGARPTTELVTNNPDEAGWRTKLVAIGQGAYFEPPEDEI